MTARKLVAEFLGTAFLLLAVVGSGIATSVDGPASVQLFQHAVVVGVTLVVLILTFGHVSGAHFNPAVTIVDAFFGGLDGAMAVRYVGAQVLGACTGVVTANLLFSEVAVQIATKDRTGLALVSSEVVATFGLVLVIFGVLRSGHVRAVPGAVGAYVAGAIFFTSSAAFANPAVTVARTLTGTWTGMAPSGVPGFVLGQLGGAALAAALVAWLFHPDARDALQVVVPHEGAADPSGHAQDLAHEAGLDVVERTEHQLGL